MQRLIEWLKSLFKKKSDPIADPIKSEPVREQPTPSPKEPDPVPEREQITVDDVRREMVANAMADVGKVEKGGNNRGEIQDRSNEYVGVPLGTPNCASSICYRVLKATADHFGWSNVPIKTASSQLMYSRAPAKYRAAGKLLRGMVAILQKRNSPELGHATLVAENQSTIVPVFKTVEWNTNDLGSRDGDGCWAKTRTKLGNPIMRYRGAIDYAQWLFDLNVAQEKPTKGSTPYVVQLGYKREWSKTLTLPASGKFFCESHYANRSETFAGRLFPANVHEGIEAHLDRSRVILKESYGLEPDVKLYDNPWEREWTPPEGGKAGQTARGDTKPTEKEELWQGNMMFAPGTIPKIGSRFVIRNPITKRACVIQMGYEVGPRDERLLGGVTPEVQWYLGANNSTVLELHKVDDSTPLGPVC